MNEEAVKKLADLSRLKLSDEEVLEYAGEFSDIIKYIDTLKEVSAISDSDLNSDSDSGSDLNSGSDSDSDSLLFESPTNRNVVREDINPSEPGLNTEKILQEAPETKDGYIKVKKVL